jgi:hypothetical protein
MMHKSCVNVEKHEVNRGVRVDNSGIIEYISFSLSNRTGLFQEDLYLDFQSTEPSSDYDEWASGIDKTAKLQRLTPQVSTGVCPKKANFAAKLAGKQVAAAVATPAEINNDELIALRAEVERLKAA